MKKIILALGFIFPALMLNAQKVSILGDSYSTYEGWIPEGNENWYGPGIGNDVNDVNQTWWKQLIDSNGLELELNNSWSGATICNTGYRGEDYTNRSFLTRASSLGENPDIIFIFGGTNDAWAKSPLGEFSGSDMYSVRPATMAMLHKVNESYPEALKVVILNTEISNDVIGALIKACETENIPYIQLENIDKQRNHPSIHGMKQIAHQVWKATAPLYYQHLKNK